MPKLIDKIHSIAQTQDTPKGRSQMNQANSQSNNQITMNPTNKFDFQPLSYAYDALEP
jgi:hypothetical protein